MARNSRAINRQPSAADVRFDRIEHRYWLGDDEIPSVGRILRLGGLVDESYFDEEIAQRGRYVSEAIALLCRDNLDRDTVASAIAPYLAAFERLRDDEGFEVLSSEEVIFDPGRWYAGTLDVSFRIRQNSIVTYGILENKTGMDAPWHRLQVEAYRRAKPRPTPRKQWKPFLAYLQKDGTHSGLVPVTPREAFASWRTFQHALALFNWRLDHGDRTAFTDRTAADHIGSYEVSA